MGLLVAQGLAAKQSTAMYVANRTFGRAVRLAEKIGGKAVRINELVPRYHTLGCGDLPHICATCDRLVVVERGDAGPVLAGQGSSPPPHHSRYCPAPGCRGGCRCHRWRPPFTIDDLRQVNEQTMRSAGPKRNGRRRMSTTNWNSSSASGTGKSADDCIAALHTWAEAVRLRERDKALARLASADDRTIEVIDDLSRVLTKKILTDATASIRTCAERRAIAARQKRWCRPIRG